MSDPARLSVGRSHATACGGNATAWDWPRRSHATALAIADAEQPAWSSMRPVSDHSIRQVPHRLDAYDGWHGVHCTQARESCQVRLKRGPVAASLTLGPSPAWSAAAVKGRPAPAPPRLDLAEHPRHRGRGLVRGIRTAPSEPTGRRLVRTDEAAGTLGPGTEDGDRLPQLPALEMAATMAW